MPTDLSAQPVGVANFVALHIDQSNRELLEEMIRRSNVRTDFFIICLVSSGTASVRINLQQIDLKTNDLLIIPPDATKDKIEIHDNVSLKIVGYSSGFLIPLRLPANFWEVSDFFSAKNIPCWHLDTANAAMISSLILRMQEINSDEYSHPYKIELLQYYFMIFILEMGALASRFSQDSTRRFTRKELLTIQYFSLVKKHFKEERSLAFYSAALFVTPKYLTETVKEVSGQTAGEVIDSYTVQEAKIQLETTSKTISEIADLLQFSDQSSFGKFFKRMTGIAPKYYRSIR